VSADDFVIVGRLGRTRGVAGELWITPDTDFPERFLRLKEIYVEERGQWHRWSIVRTQLIGGRPTIKLEGVDSREAAARLTNRPLAVPRPETVKPPEGSYLVSDLEGCEVYDHDSGRLVGRLCDVERYPAHDVYVIELASGKEARFPAVTALVKEIDIARKRIVVDRAGLVDADDGKAFDDE
jgi:16S rRNA processing protein RimM